MSPSNSSSSLKAPGGRCQGGVDGPGLRNGDLGGHLSLDQSQRVWGRQSTGGETCSLDAQRHGVTTWDAVPWGQAESHHSWRWEQRELAVLPCA